MKTRNLFFILLFAFLFSNLYSQNQPGDVKELKKIYESLEYNTIAFNDLKPKWLTNDPVFIRDIFNRFVVKNALRINDKKITDEELKAKVKDVHDGNILIDLRRRYYDKEIEFFAFIPASEVDKENPKYAFDPITDGFYLKDIIGNKLYEKLQEQSYFLEDITKTEYDVKAGYFFRLNFNLLDPEIVFWGTTSNERNKYLISFFGKWGNDLIFNPGWYSREYVGGVGLTYYKNLSADPRDFTYSVKLGTTFPSSTPYKGENPEKPLFQSGQSIYFQVTGNVLSYIMDGVEDFDFTLEGKFTQTEYKNKEFGLTSKTEFYTNKTYLIIQGIYRNIFNAFDLGMFNAGLGISMWDINNMEVDPTKTKPTYVGKKKSWLDKFDNSIYGQFGLTRYGGLIQHDVNFIIGYLPANGFGYVGFRGQFMLSDNFGLDFRIFSGAGTDSNNLPKWRKDTYLVFSPIIKINY
jgi:hypothetical protein